MVLELVDELALHRVVVAVQALEVDAGELDEEAVGHQAPVAAEDLGVVVALALQGGRDLDGLHGAAEGAGEGTGDHLLELVLEALQGVHVVRLLSGGPSGPRRSYCQGTGPPGTAAAEPRPRHRDCDGPARVG